MVQLWGRRAAVVQGPEAVSGGEVNPVPMPTLQQPSLDREVQRVLQMDSRALGRTLDQLTQDMTSSGEADPKSVRALRLSAAVANSPAAEGYMRNNAVRNVTNSLDGSHGPKLQGAALAVVGASSNTQQCWGSAHDGLFKLAVADSPARVSALITVGQVLKDGRVGDPQKPKAMQAIDASLRVPNNSVIRAGVDAGLQTPEGVQMLARKLTEPRHGRAVMPGSDQVDQYQAIVEGLSRAGRGDLLNQAYSTVLDQAARDSSHNPSALYHLSRFMLSQGRLDEVRGFLAREDLQPMSINESARLGLSWHMNVEPVIQAVRDAGRAEELAPELKAFAQRAVTDRGWNGFQDRTMSALVNSERGVPSIVAREAIDYACRPGVEGLSLQTGFISSLNLNSLPAEDREYAVEKFSGALGHDLERLSARLAGGEVASDSAAIVLLRIARAAVGEERVIDLSAERLEELRAAASDIRDRIDIQHHFTPGFDFVTRWTRGEPIQ